MTYPLGISSPKLNSNKKGYVMGKNKVITLKKPGEISEDPLTDVTITLLPTIFLQDEGPRSC
jgi:hypothetical protein